MYSNEAVELAVAYNRHLRERMTEEVREAAGNADFEKADELVETYIESSTVINQMIAWAYEQNQNEQIQEDINNA